MSRLTLSFKGKMLKIFPLEKDEVVIGSSPDCDITIDSLAIHEQHALLGRSGNGWQLKDLNSPGGTFVNGEKIDERALESGDEIGIGKHTLEADFDIPMPETVADNDLTPETPRRAKSAWLQLLNGHNVGKTISLNRNLTNLGKPGVQTAVIARRNEGFFLSHLEGDHPPEVNNTSIGDHSWRLEDGDTIQIGNVKLQFYLQ
ncbi:FHA domain-containing protein [Thiohalomonas denitrificans]|uniref:FHA domain-containing protein n=1 Tax=Thiohalomonas denitrificans TaxID=415747 RepID=A0A1G5PKP5_9GAMM|nr:FHA domain-containing protein [Thiohalomonas denitrificans]SCZ49751.1 FHA domain-containing protein [Thiohalomonas denitrificans]